MICRQADSLGETEEPEHRLEMRGRIRRAALREGEHSVFGEDGRMTVETSALEADARDSKLDE